MNKRIIATSLVISSLFASSAFAMSSATTTIVTGAFTDLKTDVLALIDLAWTAAIPVTVAFIVLKLFKKAASSAV